MPKLGTLFAGDNGEDFRWAVGTALENVEFKAQRLYSFQVSFRPTEVSDWRWPLFWCYLGNTPFLISFLPPILSPVLAFLFWVLVLFFQCLLQKLQSASSPYCSLPKISTFGTS